MKITLTITKEFIGGPDDIWGINSVTGEEEGEEDMGDDYLIELFKEDIGEVLDGATWTVSRVPDSGRMRGGE